MLNTVLGRIGLPILIDVVAQVLGRINNPVAQSASRALEETQKAINAGAITPEATAEANRHLERMAELAQKENSDALAQVNQTMRNEADSPDVFVRRMRPTFGYMMAVTWGAQMLGVAYIMVFDTKNAAMVLQAVESLSAIWAIALSVLGLYVYKRSDEKRPVIIVPPAGEAVDATARVATDAGAPRVDAPVPARKPPSPAGTPERGRFNQ